MSKTVTAINFDYMKNNLLRDATRMAVGESVKFFKESFVNSGFTDATLQKSKKAKSA
jgi:hypothetical protein